MVVRPRILHACSSKPAEGRRHSGSAQLGAPMEKGGTLPDAGRREKQVNIIIKETVARRRGF